MKLDEKFNNQAFSDWVEDFLPGFSRDVRKVDALKSFSGLKSIHTLGESSLGVRVYTIEMETDPSRRKVGLATDSFSLLRNYGTPNAIVVYFSEDSSQWRLSLLTSTPIWNEGKIITKLSNPKRQSYVLGPKAKVKTPHQYLVTKGAVADFTDLKSRFSLEVVNKEFYKEISQAFIKLVGGTLSNGRSKQTFKPLLKLPFVTDHSQTSLEFAVRLIGRIIFCWFLREKRSASGNTLMPRELLSSEASNSTEDYYHRILEPIFFEILNKPIKTRKEAYGNELFSAIPYLNGGLFSPHEDDFFNYNDGKQAVNHNMVSVPDEWLRSLLAVLETYNFTIDENTSFDEELSIDPEMLGRIFENLLAEINPETGESARKSTGSYYTPRVIVDYMVDESLKLYLSTKTNVSEEKLKSLISYDLEDDETNPLNNAEKDKIAEALGKIKILDPACGSGAFPIGALQKIVFILQQIDQNGQLWFKKQIQNTPVELRRVIEREFQEKNFDYIRKLGIIRENIYGIDIQPIATEISRLRCFLTLVVDERVDDTLENRGIEPLPNLDFKFVTANTLVGLPSSDLKANQMGLFEDDQGIKNLKEVRDMFFNASGFERDQLKLQFVQTQNKMFQKLINEGLRGHADMTSMLTTWDPFSHKSAAWFDTEWMFGIKDGFDVIIANPPYIFSRENLNSEQKEYFHKNYELTQFKLNLYVLFIEKSFNFLSSDGNFAFIIPNNWLTLSTASKLREFILKKTYNTKILLHYDSIFESASVDNCILIFNKSGNKNISFYSWQEEGIALLSSNSPEKFLSVKGHVFGNINSQSEIHGKILDKINKISEKLGVVCEVRNGVQAYTVGEGNPIQSKEIKLKRAYHSNEKHDESWLKYLDGVDINRYFIKWSNQYIKYGDNLSRPRQERLFKDERLIIRQIPAQPPYCIVGTFIEETAVVDNNCLIIKKNNPNYDLKYVLGLLNSRLISYWFIHTFGKMQRKTFPQFKVNELRDFPILLSDLKLKNDMIVQVEKLMNYTSQNDKGSFDNSVVNEIQESIDQIVYQIYRISDEELKIIKAAND